LKRGRFNPRDWDEREVIEERRLGLRMQLPRMAVPPHLELPLGMVNSVPRHRLILWNDKIWQHNSPVRKVARYPGSGVSFFNHWIRPVSPPLGNKEFPLFYWFSLCSGTCVRGLKTGGMIQCDSAWVETTFQ